LAYFSALAEAVALFVARSFLAASRAALAEARVLASLAIFFLIFSGTTLALKQTQM
jgi:hypothetical protein